MILQKILKNIISLKGDEKENNNLKIQFDCLLPPIKLTDMVSQMVALMESDGEPFSPLQFLAKNLQLELSVILQSDISLFLLLMQIQEIFPRIKRLALDSLTLYETDFLSLQQSTIANKECLNLTEISFRNCSFMTSAQTDGADGTIQQFNLSHIFTSQ